MHPPINTKYRYYEISDLSNPHVNEIMKKGFQHSMFRYDILARNYCYEFRDDPRNIFYILEEGRYKDSSYFVVVDEDDNFMASAGWNGYTEDTALMITRMCVNPKYRNQYIIGNDFLPVMIERAFNYKNIWITCNDYNQVIYNWFERAAQGKPPSVDKTWPDVYRRFKPIGKKEVYYVVQNVVELDRSL
jgi:hypothetical protein